MQISELEKATEEVEDGVSVVTIKVSNHKTGMTERARVGLSGQIIDHLHMWVEIVKSIHPSSPLVFPSWKGQEVIQLTQKVQKLASTLGIDLPTTREVRPNIEIRSVGLADTERSLVSRHLSHSTATAERSYRALESSKRARAFNVVGGVMGIEQPAPLPVRNCKKFTAEEEEVIREHFSEHIQSKVAPRMKEAENFLKQYAFEGRSSKDIYDKVCNMYRYS